MEKIIILLNNFNWNTLNFVLKNSKKYWNANKFEFSSKSRYDRLMTFKIYINFMTDFRSIIKEWQWQRWLIGSLSSILFMTIFFGHL